MPRPSRQTHKPRVVSSSKLSWLRAPATTFTELKNKSDPSPLSALARIACEIASNRDPAPDARKALKIKGKVIIAGVKFGCET